MAEIEISEGDMEAADRLSGPDYRMFPGDHERNAEIIAEVRTAATTAERERIAAKITATHDENLRQGSNRVYGLMAVLDMLNLIAAPGGEVAQ